MNWKRFFKPTIWTLLLTIVIFAGFYELILSYGTGLHVDCFEWHEGCGYHPPRFDLGIGFKGMLVLAYFLSYLISCLLLYFIKREKK
ncbi:MAG: hypothetical protein ABIB97_00465 [Patescibacteria group bacterium]